METEPLGTAGRAALGTKALEFHTESLFPSPIDAFANVSSLASVAWNGVIGRHGAAASV